MIAGEAGAAPGRPRGGRSVHKSRWPEDLALTAADPLALAARKILARQALVVSQQVEGTIAGRDPERLHDLRVASRRARAALRLLRAVLPAERVAVWRQELRWLGSLSGAARDADVFGARVRLHLRALGVPAAVRRPLLALLVRDRQQARRRLVEALRSERFTRLMTELQALPGQFETVGAGEAKGSARDLAPALVRRELGRLRRWRRRRIELLTAAELHAIRIAGKRARYALEFFAELLAPELKRHIRTFVTLQDCLGAHQDAVVARSRLADAARRLAAAGAPAETLHAVEVLMRREREAAAGRRRELAELGPELFALVKRLLRELGG
ncbi:MAG TPA: CHAD domain-containing protein [Thermoanaerobaculaceae bacterium]|nr:CHAD domain-containing protein [Thermoanaerobaculaceae bacterium]HRS16020.1 CHAD domain-containing protein [Thermoanaerobaculaceae bacterium]